MSNAHDPVAGAPAPGFTLPEGEIAVATLPGGRDFVLRRATGDDAERVLAIMHAAFAARPVHNVLPKALAETVDTVRAVIESSGGYLVEIDKTPAASILIKPDDPGVRLGRVGVHPDFQGLGVAGTSVSALLEALASVGVPRASVLVRKDYPELARWWSRRGFVAVGHEDDLAVMENWLPVVVEVPDADAMRDLGVRTAALVRAGDVIVATGDLGAGKTTFTQGLGAGMDVDGPVISPTFVLSRIHPPRGKGPALVHVDAYRLADAEELLDLDLESSVPDSVTLVEWGEGVAEPLSPQRLRIDIRRGLDPADETRWVFFTGVGERWSHDDLATLATARRQDRS
ncbi:tRNA (adenosine(37)-N6)-threonylcarbamoyltransferase complex ATPase subunit type 1 TsaE [Nigerium massiliense]|uniref:tRNA (adenosine(37)-N6)-threonylcarbamoyltransferase complex ATPase subunit type 1 TsaE n=1 Tax=Nigerium massiliense TaxID=1522317 RepID=UPI001F0251FB|nr:tRNA (adenosine(37)-N6)-threonylcarbamoyltransferase complex ATPase subunit type 1 TsaE [Nigerium massiliense]